MRILSLVLFGSMLFVFASGCKKESYDQPKTKPHGKGEQDPAQKDPAPSSPQSLPSPEPKPVPQERTKKGGTGIVSNIRGAAYRTERKSELKQLALSYTQFSDEYKGANRTKENFLAYIKTYGPIREAVETGYYTMNFKAQPGSGSSVVAYETDIDTQGYLAARGDGSVDYISAADLKAAVGK